MSKIVFAEVRPWEQEYVKLHSGSWAGDIIFSESIVSKDNFSIPEDTVILSVFVNSIISREVIDRLPKLKLVVTRSTGYDHVDVKACQEKGISVSYVPSYGENTVAEFAFALILSLSRKIYQSFDQIRESGSFSVSSLQGFDLKGKTLGVVGTGRIGQHSIRMAKGFDMEVAAYDTHPNEELSKNLDFTYWPLEEVLKKSDIVTLHVPYLPETHHLMNERTLRLMKKGSILINTSRGGVVDTSALVEVLKDGHLGGAGLDVLEEEGVIKDELSFLKHGHPEEHNLKTILAGHILIDMPNVIITPHNAFNTQEALQRILNTTIENISGFNLGSPVNVIQPH